MSKQKNLGERLKSIRSLSLKNWELAEKNSGICKNKVIDCGWGRLIFGQTFENNENLLAELQREKAGERDIAFYVRNPHVLIGLAPQEVFLDPSHAFRFWFHKNLKNGQDSKGIFIRKASQKKDILAANKIYATRGMLPLRKGFYDRLKKSKDAILFLAGEEKTGEILGVAIGIDHFAAFRDPENGTSLWALAVDPQAGLPGVGLALTRHVIDYFRAQGRNYLDISVMHDNKQAIRLYEKVGFERVPVFCVKRKNAINEHLFTQKNFSRNSLTSYAQIIVDAAVRRGISAKATTEQPGMSLKLNFGGRAIACYESLTELSNAIAVQRCQDKQISHRILAKANFNVPVQISGHDPEKNSAFLAKHKKVVVKPSRGEQGFGVSADIRTDKNLQNAVAFLQKAKCRVLLEEFRKGQDLRIVLINFKVVAAAIRQPAEIIGTGQHTIRQLIQKQSRRRSASTQGASKIPIDDETKRCVRQAGFKLADTLAKGKRLQVRRTANLHTGGTMHDVTPELHPHLKKVAERAARVLDIPVVGLDLIIDSPKKNKYCIIEANERPGLANHEPQAPVEEFLDFLYPQTAK
ncbi:MAG: N-acetylglutaminylglutamine synthetase [Candidatus Peribacteraceae bacterium]|nr:N-acetylglutaminylglutamine synthetase [Candidatus Peribacteraceae bacterium]